MRRVPRGPLLQRKVWIEDALRKVWAEVRCDAFPEGPCLRKSLDAEALGKICVKVPRGSQKRPEAQRPEVRRGSQRLPETPRGS